ncbi:MAG: outer membrane protein transport protein [Prolixibacteraceae bacterium]
MKKLYFTLFALLGFITYSSAQYVDNALVFSQQNYGSTARLKAMGNAFGALGGDFGSLSINPAGIGIFQRSEFSTTMGMLNQNSTETNYQGNLNKMSNDNFNFKNFGYVSAIPSGNNSSGLVSFNFGLGYNRLANYNQSSFAGAPASASSRMDAFAQNTNGIKYNDLVTTDNYDPYNNGIPWESKLAWENYLIDVANPTAGGDRYSTFLYNDEKVKQSQSSNQEGYLNEYLATFGANINHKLYLGMTLGMQDMYLDDAKFYTESGLWGSFDYTSSARSSGVGYNLKFGVIYRPTPVLRIGAALHTPTYFFIKETYNSVMSSKLVDVSADANGTHYEASPQGNYEYNFNSPLHAIGSIAYQFAKKGLVSLDYELVDYSAMKYKSGNDGYQFGAENGDIKTIYKAVSNLRIGAEYRMTEALSLRGGLEFLGNPYASNSYGVAQPNADYKFRTYNAGLGYRVGKLSLDLTYGLNDKTHYMYIYQVDGVAVDPVKFHTLHHELLFTIAMKI